MSAAETPQATPRTLRDAVFDALPDAGAAAACLLTWIKPDAFGTDLLRSTGALFFVELPLAMVVLFAGVRRLEDRAMSRRTKLGFVFWPTLILLPIVAVILGPWALLALLWLAAGDVWRVLSGSIDRSPPVRGAWITYTEGEGGTTVSAGDVHMGVRRGRGRGAREWRVQAGHEQVMASLTLMCAVAIVFVFAVVDIGPGGLAAEYVSTTTWEKFPIGAIVPAHYAVAAGLALFGARLPMHFEGIGPEPADQKPVRIEDDPVLREIVRKIDRGSSPRK